MNIYRSGWAGILFLSALYASSGNTAPLPVPDDADLQIVAQDMLHNGSRLYLAALESEQSLADTVSFYQTLWSQPVAKGLPGFVQSESGGWLLISRLENQTHTVIQLDRSTPERTSGWISRMALEESVATIAKRPLADLTELSSTSTRDGTSSSTLSVYGSYASTHATIKKVAVAMVGEGWSLMSMAKEQGSQIAIFVKAAHRAEIVAVSSDDYPCLVIVNEVTSQ